MFYHIMDTFMQSYPQNIGLVETHSVSTEPESAICIYIYKDTDSITSLFQILLWYIFCQSPNNQCLVKEDMPNLSKSNVGNEIINYNLAAIVSS